jgi:hypothetical protein
MKAMKAARTITFVLMLGIGISSPAAAQPEPPPAYPAPPPAYPAPAPPPAGQPGYHQPYHPPAPRAPYRPLKPTRESRPSAIYGELLGKGLLYSVGFDYAIRKWIAAGASFSYFDSAAFISPYINFYPVGGRRSALLLQAGVQLVHVNEEHHELLKELLWTEKGLEVGGQVSIGYEFRAGFLFRVAMLAMFNKNGVLPWPGLTFGGSF